MSDNYASLRNVLVKAHKRASQGKGKERHATDNPFESQPIITEGEHFGISAHLYQIRKKCLEILRMDIDAAQRELLDIIVYAAATHIILGGKKDELRTVHTGWESVSELPTKEYTVSPPLCRTSSGED